MKFLFSLTIISIILSCPFLFQTNGPWAQTYDVIPSIQSQYEYNDNIFFDADNEDRIKDHLTTTTPGLQLTCGTERMDTRIKGSMHIMRYRDSYELDDTDYNSLGIFRYQMTPRNNISTQAQYSKDSRRDRDIEFTGMILGTATRYRQQYSFTDDYRVSETSSAALSYSYGQDDFDDIEFVDSNSHLVSLGYSRRFSMPPEQNIFRMNAGYARYNFLETTFDRVDNFFLSMGIIYQLTECLSLSLEAGERYTSTRYAVMYPSALESKKEKSKAWGSIGRLGLFYKGLYTSFSLTLSHDIKPVSGNSGTTKRSSARADISYSITEDLKCSLYAGYYLNKAVKDELSDEDIDEITVLVQPVIRYDIIKYIGIEASYTYAFLRDRINETDASRNIYLIRAILQYPLFE